MIKNNRVNSLLLGFLVLCIIIGAVCRADILKRYYRCTEGLGAYVSMASNFQRAPGMYSWEEYLYTMEKPQDYVYTVGKSKFKPISPLNSELGWGLVLHLILREGLKGMDNIALTIARHQLMIDLFVIVFLFFIGKHIAGIPGACLSAFLYSVFKIPMVLMSEVAYYYWTIPFSVLSLLFWVVIYGTYGEKLRTPWKYLSFFIYGILMGFAGFVRLYFVFLPIFMSPLIFIRERSLKKGIVFLLLILLGQSVFMIPQVLYVKKHFGKYAITARGHWHLVLQGIGFYPDNPWGIKDSGEINLNEWAVRKGAPDMFKPLPDGTIPTELVEKWYKKEVFKMFREHPEIFIKNFLKHFKEGLAIYSADFRFYGVLNTHRAACVLNDIFPWLLMSGFLLMFFMSRDRFWIALSVFLQGIYLLLSVTTWFASYAPFLASYVPVFVLLFATVVTAHLNFFMFLARVCVKRIF